MNVLLDKPRKLVNSVVSLELITNVEFKTVLLLYFLLQQYKAAAQVKFNMLYSSWTVLLTDVLFYPTGGSEAVPCRLP